MVIAVTRDQAFRHIAARTAIRLRSEDLEETTGFYGDEVDPELEKALESAVDTFVRLLRVMGGLPEKPKLS